MSPRVEISREHVIIQSVGVTILLDRDRLRRADQQTVSQLLAELEEILRDLAALERATESRLDPQPGQNVSYVVVDDSKRSRDRVQLTQESPDQYDVGFYSDLLIRAAESVCAPVGRRYNGIEKCLSDYQDTSLTAFHGCRSE